MKTRIRHAILVCAVLLCGSGAAAPKLADQATPGSISTLHDLQSSPAFVLLPLLAVFGAFAVLHAQVFAAHPRERGNLFFSLFAFTVALVLALECWRTIAPRGAGAEALAALAGPVLTLVAFLAFLIFLQESLETSRTRAFWWITALATLGLFGRSALRGTALALLPWLVPVLGFVVAAARALRLGRARGRKVGLLVLSSLLASAYLIATVGHAMGWGGRWFRYDALAFFGLVGVVTCASLSLARRFGETNRELEIQLQQVRELSDREIANERRLSELRLQQAQERATHERRAFELAQAATLQSSMLPRAIPEVPGLEIAAFSKPATEVGGDYYDFEVDADGTLTIAIGDATGHGLGAGTMVTAVKALFASSAHRDDPAEILSEASRALSKMKLPGMFMSLAVVKIRGRALRVSVAAMPPPIVFRHEARRVETISQCGVPLGRFWPYAYSCTDLDLHPGDALLLMSDGFPERLNERDEAPGYDHAATVLANLGDRSARDIIDGLARVGDAWAGGREQNDDVTVVVVKVR